MGAAMDQWLVFECLYPFGNMADFAVFFGQVSDDIGRIGCYDMSGTGTVTDFAAGILEMRGLFKADESPRLAVTGGMTGIAFLYLLRGEMFHLLLNALE